jgi:hypothetical protein
MVAMLKRYPALALLAVAAVLLAAAVVYEVASGPGSQPGGAAGGKVAAVQLKLLPPIQPVVVEEAYPETTARPLLSPTRRPAPEKAVAGTSTMQKGMYTLTGVTIVGSLRIALLREKSSGRVLRAEKGKDLNGVTVAEIEPESVTLAAGGDQEVIPLLVQKGPAAPAAPAAAAAAAAGPFAVPMAVPGAEAPAAAQNPAARPMPIAPPPAPGPPPPSPPSSFGPAGGQPAAGQSAPMTPEELLARRRARRTQQTQ